MKARTLLDISALPDESSLALESGRMCLEFANTVEWHSSEAPQETLHSFGDLLAWAQRVGILAEPEATALADRAAANPSLAHSVYRDAIELREVIYRTFAALAHDGIPSSEDIDLLNVWVEAAYRGLKLIRFNRHFEWQFAASDSLSAWLYPIVRSAATLLTSGEVARVGQCADDRGCGYLFFDTSRNRSRRWCDMKGCGNRAKVRRHVARRPDLRESNRG